MYVFKMLNKKFKDKIYKLQVTECEYGGIGAEVCEDQWAKTQTTVV